MGMPSTPTHRLTASHRFDFVNFSATSKQLNIERRPECDRAALQKRKLTFIRMPLIRHSRKSFSLLPVASSIVAIFIKMSRMAIQISKGSLSSPRLRLSNSPFPISPENIADERTTIYNKINTHRPHHRKVVNQAKNTCIRIPIFGSLLNRNVTNSELTLCA